MSYIELKTENELKELIAESFHKPQVIFKHSTRCFISSRVLKNTLSSFEDPRADWHLLDLIAFRNISNDIEKMLNVTHQSPQIIIIHKGIAPYNASHEQILSEAIFEQLDNLNR
jgi:bacillithiol system protein YtxJ